jgi:hypothetical protein
MIEAINPIAVNQDRAEISNSTLVLMGAAQQTLHPAI